MWILLSNTGDNNDSKVNSSSSNSVIVTEDPYKEPSNQYMIGFMYNEDDLLQYGPYCQVKIRYDKKAEVVYYYYYYERSMTLGPVCYDLTDEQYDNISKMFDYNKLFYLDPEVPDMDLVCDGGFVYLNLYGNDDQVSKNVGGFCPHNKYFCEMLRACLDNMPEEISEEVKYLKELENDEVLIEVPDYISNRGIIVPGVEDTYTGLWEQQYRSDCNLFVNSTGDEFIEFLDSLNVHYELSDPVGPDAYPEYMSARIIDSDGSGYEIYRTCYYPFDKSTGWTPQDTEEPTPINMMCYDPSGKYLIIGDDIVSGPAWMDFIEPEMTEVSVAKGTDESATVLSEAEEIKEYIDAFHSLEATIDDVVKTKKLEEAEESYTIIFTAENGNVTEYNFGVFHGNLYYFVGDQVYKLENTDALEALIK